MKSFKKGEADVADFVSVLSESASRNREGDSAGLELVDKMFFLRKDIYTHFKED